MSSFLALVRMGRRSIRRYPLRSLLVSTLIALTVAAGTFAAVAARTTSVSADDVEQAQLGSGDFLARFGTTNIAFGDSFGPEPLPVNGAVRSATIDHTSTDEGIAAALEEQRLWSATFDPVAFERDIEADLDIDISVSRQAFRSFSSGANGPFGGGSGASRLITDLDLAHPLNEGSAELFEGRLPTASDEIAVAARFNNLGRGEAVGTSYQVGSEALTIVGVVTNPLSRYGPISIVDGAAFDRLVTPEEGVLFHVRARLAGTSVSSEDLAAAISDAVDRPVWARDQTRALLSDGTWDEDALRFLTESEYNNNGNNGAAALPYVISSILGIQVVLVAAAAFAVGIRRRTREFGQLLALGGDDSHVRRLVFTEAGLLGVAGAVAGLLTGVAAAWFIVGQGWLDSAGNRLPTSVRWSVADWLGPAAIGLAAALLAAWWPARSLANAPIPSTLAGSTPPVRLRPHVSKWGVVVAAVGIVTIAVGARDITNGRGEGTSGYLLLLAGVTALLLGTMMMIGSILSLIGNRADRFPLLARLVARNSDRQRARSWVIIGSFIVALVVPILVGSSIKAYPNSYNGDQVSEVSDRMLVIRQQLFGFPGEDLSGVGPELRTFNESLDALIAEEAGPFTQAPMHVAPDLQLYLQTGQSSYGFGNTVLVATDEMTEVLGIDEDLLASLDQTALLDISVNSQVRSEGELVLERRSSQPGRSTPVELVQGPPLFRSDTFMVTAEGAAAIGVDPTNVGTIRILAEPISWDQERAIRSAADAMWVEAFGDYDPSDFSPREFGDSPDPALEMSITRSSSQGLNAGHAQWIALGVSLALAALVALVTSALSAVEMDSEISSMIATGAAPTMRRKILGAQTFYHLVIASVLAIPAAVLLFYAVASADDFGPRGLVFPWTSIALTAILVPTIVSLLIAATFRNGRPAISRRLS